MIEIHGRKNQIETFFRENFHSLVFTSFRIVKDYEQAEDIVQDVFVKILQNFDKIKDKSNLSGYLHTAVKNSSLNYLRDYQQINNNKISIDGISVGEPQDNKNSDTDILIRKLHQEVDKLPEKWREAFILSKYENFKYYEIAEKMKISNKTVEKYISKALVVLRSKLKHLISITIFIKILLKI